jgi:hypothetical protein
MAPCEAGAFAAFLTAERSLHAVLQQLADPGVIEAPWFDITDDLPQYAEYAPPG